MSNSVLVKLISYTDEVCYVNRDHVRMVVPVPGDKSKAVIIFDADHRLAFNGSVDEVVSWLRQEKYVRG